MLFYWFRFFDIAQDNAKNNRPKGGKTDLIISWKDKGDSVGRYPKPEEGVEAFINARPILFSGEEIV